MSPPKLPASLAANPSLNRWITFLPNKTVRVASGKVEIGQGIVTALRQIAAEELDIDLSKLSLASGDTEIGPDENYTTSSLSIMASGAAIRAVTSEARALLTERAALRLNCAPEDLEISNGEFLKNQEVTGVDYWDVADEIDWARNATASFPHKTTSSYKIVGKNTPRDDLGKKVMGSGFIHDISEKNLLHARMLRQPSPEAQLSYLDEEAIKRAAGGDIQILRKGNFIALIADEEWLAEKAARAAYQHVVWSGVSNIPKGAADARKLPGQDAVENFYGDPVTAASTPGKKLKVTVTRPYVAHASLGPSVALARWENGKLEIWSHGQGMHPLRRNLALALNIDENSFMLVMLTVQAVTGIMEQMTQHLMQLSSLLKFLTPGSACNGSAMKNLRLSRLALPCKLILRLFWMLTEIQQTGQLTSGVQFMSRGQARPALSCSELNLLAL